LEEGEKRRKRDKKEKKFKLNVKRRIVRKTRETLMQNRDFISHTKKFLNLISIIKL